MDVQNIAFGEFGRPIGMNDLTPVVSLEYKFTFENDGKHTKIIVKKFKLDESAYNPLSKREREELFDPFNAVPEGEWVTIKEIGAFDDFEKFLLEQGGRMHDLAF